MRPQSKMTKDLVTIVLERPKAELNLSLVKSQISLLEESIRFGYMNIPKNRQADYLDLLKTQLERYQVIVEAYTEGLYK